MLCTHVFLSLVFVVSWASSAPTVSLHTSERPLMSHTENTEVEEIDFTKLESEKSLENSQELSQILKKLISYLSTHFVDSDQLDDLNCELRKRQKFIYHDVKGKIFPQKKIIYTTTPIPALGIMKYTEIIPGKATPKIQYLNIKFNSSKKLNQPFLSTLNSEKNSSYQSIKEQNLQYNTHSPITPKSVLDWLTSNSTITGPENATYKNRNTLLPQTSSLLNLSNIIDYNLFSVNNSLKPENLIKTNRFTSDSSILINEQTVIYDSRKEKDSKEKAFMTEYNPVTVRSSFDEYTTLIRKAVNTTGATESKDSTLITEKLYSYSNKLNGIKYEGSTTKSIENHTQDQLSQTATQRYTEFSLKSSAAYQIPVIGKNSIGDTGNPINTPITAEVLNLYSTPINIPTYYNQETVEKKNENEYKTPPVLNIMNLITTKDYPYTPNDQLLPSQNVNYSKNTSPSLERNNEGIYLKVVSSQEQKDTDLENQFTTEVQHLNEKYFSLHTFDTTITSKQHEESFNRIPEVITFNPLGVQNDTYLYPSVKKELYSTINFTSPLMDQVIHPENNQNTTTMNYYEENINNLTNDVNFHQQSLHNNFTDSTEKVKNYFSKTVPWMYNTNKDKSQLNPGITTMSTLSYLNEVLGANYNYSKLETLNNTPQSFVNVYNLSTLQFDSSDYQTQSLERSNVEKVNFLKTTPFPETGKTNIGSNLTYFSDILVENENNHLKGLIGKDSNLEINTSPKVPNEFTTALFKKNTIDQSSHVPNSEILLIKKKEIINSSVETINGNVNSTKGAFQETSISDYIIINTDRLTNKTSPIKHDEGLRNKYSTLPYEIPVSEKTVSVLENYTNSTFTQNTENLKSIDFFDNSKAPNISNISNSQFSSSSNNSNLNYFGFTPTSSRIPKNYSIFELLQELSTSIKPEKNQEQIEENMSNTEKNKAFDLPDHQTNYMETKIFEKNKSNIYSSTTSIMEKALIILKNENMTEYNVSSTTKGSERNFNPTESIEIFNPSNASLVTKNMNSEKQNFFPITLVSFMADVTANSEKIDKTSKDSEGSTMKDYSNETDEENEYYHSKPDFTTSEIEKNDNGLGGIDIGEAIQNNNDKSIDIDILTTTQNIERVIMVTSNTLERGESYTKVTQDVTPLPAISLSRTTSETVNLNVKPEKEIDGFYDDEIKSNYETTPSFNNFTFYLPTTEFFTSYLPVRIHPLFMLSEIK